MNEEIALLMERVKTQTVIFYPFFASLAMHMPVYETDKIPTMATDGSCIMYNLEWVTQVKNTDGERALIGVYIHEVMHAALLHTVRGFALHKQLFNIACDYVVNNIIDNSKIKLPAGVLIKHEYDEYSAEQIYNILLKNAKFVKSGSGGDGNGQPGDGRGEAVDTSKLGKTIDDHSGWGRETSEQKERLGEQWKQRLAAAAVNAKMQGNMPAGMERLMDEVLHPQVDWREALRNFIQPSAVDFEWNPPDRRFQEEDVAIPDLSGETVDNIVVVTDTSGSIDDKMISQFMGEIMDIVDTWPGMEGWLISCDADVHQVIHLDESFVPQKLKGGGGTDFRPPFKEVDKREMNPTCLIYLTDTYGTFPDYPPDFPVIWCVIDSPEGKVPWGERIDISTNN